MHGFSLDDEGTKRERAKIADGCVGEGLASLELAVAAEAVESPAMAAAMRKMAADERRHAELGYAIVLWAIEIAKEDERRRPEVAAALFVHSYRGMMMV